MKELMVTKGDWHFFDVGELGCGVGAPRSDVAHCHGFDSKRSKEEEKANAKLMSEAKNMYELLSDLASNYYCECGHPRCRIEETRREIDEQLAKCRGEIS